MKQAGFIINMGNQKIFMDNKFQFSIHFQFNCNFNEHQDQITEIQQNQEALTECVDIPGHTLMVVEIIRDKTPKQKYFTLDYLVN